MASCHICIMSEYRKTSADELYFVTLTVSGWTDLFTRSVYKDILVNNLIHCQEQENLNIFSYVIMSNHLHMVCRRNGKDLTKPLWTASP